MKPKYLTTWSLQSALRQSAGLIKNGSHIRLAAFCMAERGMSKTAPITINSDLCSGTGQNKLVHGLLLGAPVRTVLAPRLA